MTAPFRPAPPPQITSTLRRLQADSFIPLSERQTSGPVRCPGCSSPSAYIKGKTIIEIAYRLDSRIDHAADQGILDHLLTIAALRRRYADVYVLPGVDVWLSGETDNRELDLYGICDGEVTAGEVKQSAADFDEEQVRRGRLDAAFEQ